MLKKVVVNNQTAACFPRLGIRLMIVGIALLSFGQFVGCSSWRSLGFGESAAVAYRDMVWSKRAFNLRYGNCNRPYAEHFENGFCAGYEAVSNGEDGYIPALPPSDYRSYEYQSADGAKCVNSWFEGYPAGVAAAKKDKSGNFHDILVSRMIDSAVTQEKTNAVLPGDVKVVSANQGSDRATNGQPSAGRYNNEPLSVMPSILTPHQGNTSAQQYQSPTSGSRVVPADYSTPTGYSSDGSYFPISPTPASWK